MWEKWIRDFREPSLSVSNYKEIKAYIIPTKWPSLNISSKITMRDCSLCDDKTTAAVFIGLPPPSPKSFSYVSIWFNCLACGLSIDLWIYKSFWLMRDRFGTKSCQRHTNPDDSCRLPALCCSVQAWLGWYLDGKLGWSAGARRARQRAVKKQQGQLFFGTKFIKHLNVGLWKCQRCKDGGYRAEWIPTTPSLIDIWSGERSFIFKAECWPPFSRCQETQSSAVTVRWLDIMAPSV